MKQKSSTKTQFCILFIKKLLCLILLFISSFSFSQDFARVDATIQLYPETFEDVKKFDSFLSRDFNSDEEKVRAIYGWLINNVSYDPEAYKLFNYTFKNYKERNQKEERTRKKIINYTLETGKAICEGYAMTFEKLLTLQGIENYLIQGDTKTHFKDIDRKFNLNHMWNAIKLNETWYLFDATWGAGKYNGKFIKEPSYYFYKVLPEELIKTHYPEDISDAFLKTSIPFEIFSNQPIYINPSLVLADVETSFNGLIDTNQENDSITFGIIKKAKTIDYAYDGLKNTVKLIATNDSLTQFTIPLQRDAKTLLIYLDDKPVLGYRLK